MDTKTMYETPALEEIGGFAELTQGYAWWCPYDWYGLGYVIGC